MTPPPPLPTPTPFLARAYSQLSCQALEADLTCVHKLTMSFSLTTLKRSLFFLLMCTSHLCVVQSIISMLSSRNQQLIFQCVQQQQCQLSSKPSNSCPSRSAVLSMTLDQTGTISSQITLQRKC